MTGGAVLSKKRNKGLSIKIVTALYSSAVIVVLTIITVIVGYRLYENHVMEHYNKYTTTVLEYAYTVSAEHTPISARHVKTGVLRMKH